MDCSLLSMRFSRQEFWSGLPCPPPGDLPQLGIEPLIHLLHWQVGSLLPPGKPPPQHTPSQNGESRVLSCYSESHKGNPILGLIWIVIPWMQYLNLFLGGRHEVYLAWSQFPDSGIEPSPRQWKCWILTTRPLGSSQYLIFKRIRKPDFIQEWSIAEDEFFLECLWGSWLHQDVLSLINSLCLWGHFQVSSGKKLCSCW